LEVRDSLDGMSFKQLLLKIAEWVPEVPLVGDDLAREISRIGINSFARNVAPRPRPFSLWSAAPPEDPQAAGYVSDYTSWPGLTDRRFSARHLPPADLSLVQKLPAHRIYDGTGLGDNDRVTALFARHDSFKPSRSSLLFTFFAQWFTDSVFRFDFTDRRRNVSNHDIDLCEIYGMTEAHANILRSKKGGRLRSQMINGEELPEYLCTPDGQVKHEFYGLLPLTPGTTADDFVDGVLKGAHLGLDDAQLHARKKKLYATGLERGNSSIGYVAISVLFLREHNRLATLLATEKPDWDDERIFQTARNINIVILLRLIVEDYINHILGHEIFRLDPYFAESETWYRSNWIAAEFDLLYRWHPLVPDTLTVDGNTVAHADFRFNNALLEQVGVGAIIDEASRQSAGRVSLQNTPNFLLPAESWSIQMGRMFRLQPFNAYRSHFGLDPFSDYSELTSDRQLQKALKKVYPNINDLEFVVGLFAEEADPGLLFGDLLNQMVAYDAFTQIFSNPLLSSRIYNAHTFTELGLDAINNTPTIDALADRNLRTPVRASLGI